MRKVAVYMGNRNIYDMMSVAAKSLLSHTKMDRVYFLIDDPTFPEPLPDVIRCVNVHNQQFFPPSCPNIHPHYSYMTLMRSVLSKVLPNEHVVLLLDPDTVVCGDISPLFRTDISNYFFAAVPEVRNHTHVKNPYYNAGVMLMNLDKFRSERIDDTIIQTLNTTHLLHLEQDALNFVCDKNILALPSTYNYSFVSEPITGEPLIRHFLSFAKPEWAEWAEKYRRMSWQTAMKGDDL